MLVVQINGMCFLGGNIVAPRRRGSPRRRVFQKITKWSHSHHNKRDFFQIWYRGKNFHHARIGGGSRTIRKHRPTLLAFPSRLPPVELLIIILRAPRATPDKASRSRISVRNFLHLQIWKLGYHGNFRNIASRRRI